MSEPIQAQGDDVAAENSTQPTLSQEAMRERLIEAFSADTPMAVRERVLDAVFTVLDGNDDD